MPRKSGKKVEAVVTKTEERITADIDLDEKLLVTPNKRSAKVKIEVPLMEQTSPKQAQKKRKAKTENLDDEEERLKKAPKKRKTKEEKEAEAMPVASRTAVAGLKKAMYIGAHVSGGGGKHSIQAPCMFADQF